MFNQVMTACTENYECLVLDNTSKSNKIEDCVFWYKAKIRKNFKVGSQAIWAYHRKNYNPKHDTTPKSVNQPKKTNDLTVKKVR